MNRHVKRRIKRYVTLAALYVLEAAVAGIPTGIAAAVLIPLGVRLRGERAYGGEYLVLAVMFWAIFTMTNKYICDQIYGRREKDVKYNVCERCGAHLDFGERCDCDKKDPQPDKQQREKGGDSDGIASTRGAVPRNANFARRVG